LRPILVEDDDTFSVVAEPGAPLIVDGYSIEGVNIYPKILRRYNTVLEINHKKNILVQILLDFLKEDIEKHSKIIVEMVRYNRTRHARRQGDATAAYPVGTEALEEIRGENAQSTQMNCVLTTTCRQRNFAAVGRRKARILRHAPFRLETIAHA